MSNPLCGLYGHEQEQRPEATKREETKTPRGREELDDDRDSAEYKDTGYLETKTPQRNGLLQEDRYD